MNDKTKDLLKRLRSIPSAKALAIELEKSIKEYEDSDSRLTIDKEWLKKQIVLHKIHRDVYHAEATYVLDLACLININDGDVDEFNAHELACERLFNLMKEGK